MLVLIDADLERICIYGKKGMIETDVSNRQEIIDNIANNQVYYVTAAVEADIKDILKITEAMTQQQADTVTPAMASSGNYYLKSNVKGLLVIQDIDAKGEEARIPLISFKNDLDCQPYNAEMVKKSPHLRSLIKSGHIKIISGLQYQKYMTKFGVQEKKLQAKIDQGLDSIIVDANTKAEDFAAGGDGGMVITDDSPISPEEENENAALMKQLGMR